MYNPNHDYNTADVGGGSFELIPADTIAKVSLAIRPGGGGEGGWLTQSKSSDAQYLNCEFVVLDGPYDKRKFWGSTRRSVPRAGTKWSRKAWLSPGPSMRPRSRSIKPT